MANRAVVIFSDLLPPKRGGLADHTYHLATQLQAAGHAVTVISSVGVGTDVPFTVRPVVDDWRDGALLVAELSAVPSDAIFLWQYVPHMYGHGGVNPVLPRFMRALRRAGRKQVVIAHEIAADLSWNPGRFWYAWNHRRQWKQILEHADVIPMSTSRWVEDWSVRAKRAASKFFTLPSPSNIPVSPTRAGHRAEWLARQRLPANARVIAYFGTVNPTKRIPWILDAWSAARRADHPVAFVLVGGAPGLSLPSNLDEWYRPLGFLSAPDVSRALQAADLVALPFLDGVSERRGSVMAALEHGVAVATTVGHNTGRELAKAGWLGLVGADDRAGYARLVAELMHDDARRHQLAAAGKAQHDREFAWPVVVERLRARFP